MFEVIYNRNRGLNFYLVFDFGKATTNGKLQLKSYSFCLRKGHICPSCRYFVDIILFVKVENDICFVIINIEKIEYTAIAVHYHLIFLIDCMKHCSCLNHG